MPEQGPDDTPIQQITSRADIGLGTFDCYFENKDAIAVQVIDCIPRNLTLFSHPRQSPTAVIVSSTSLPKGSVLGRRM